MIPFLKIVFAQFLVNSCLFGPDLTDRAHHRLAQPIGPCLRHVRFLRALKISSSYGTRS